VVRDNADKADCILPKTSKSVGWDPYHRSSSRNDVQGEVKRITDALSIPTRLGKFKRLIAWIGILLPPPAKRGNPLWTFLFDRFVLPFCHSFPSVSRSHVSFSQASDLENDGR
jgi:hypothetical protein